MWTHYWNRVIRQTIICIWWSIGGPNLSELSWHVTKYDLIWSLPRYQSSWGQHGAHLGPVGPRWASCWSHEPCYQGIYPQEQRDLFLQNTDYESINPFVMSPKLHITQDVSGSVRGVQPCSKVIGIFFNTKIWWLVSMHTYEIFHVAWWGLVCSLWKIQWIYDSSE